MKLSLIAPLGRSKEYHEGAHIVTDTLVENARMRERHLYNADSTALLSRISKVSSYLLAIQLSTSFT